MPRASAMSKTFRPELKLRVPASSSNLGPGFDCVGLALSLFLEVEIERSEGGGALVFDSLAGEAEGWPAPERNVFGRALERVASELGAALPPIVARVRSEIPLGRGLGSSGAAVAAGLLAACRVLGREVEPRRLAAWGTQIEGHPDNVTAALLGGCTLALPHAGGLRVAAQPVHVSIGFAVAWPASALPTERARDALPASVALRDAIENPRRLAMLLEGLRSGEAELLRLGCEDRLHVPYRLPLIAGAAEALDAAREAGAWCATISGSGSGLIALGPRERMEEVAASMRGRFEERDPPACARVVEVVRGGVRVEPCGRRA